jgi:pimeloyl-ACP methyl ester carboxylesterase
MGLRRRAAGFGRAVAAAGDRRVIVLLGVLSALALETAPAQTPATSFITVRSKDGAPIAAECAGAGPSLVIVHGGTGDHTRWTPLFPHFASRFTVCAMDRRGFGRSGDSPGHSLLKEAEDVAAVVGSQPGKVFVLGHSYGAVVALEAAFLTDKIRKLVLYEAPLQERVDPRIMARMEERSSKGDRDGALTIFLGEVVKVAPEEIRAMKGRPSWVRLTATIHQSPRQMRALNAYRLDSKRIASLRVPVLLLTGSETTNPSVKMAALADSLPNRAVVVLQGETHFAMDTNPRVFADVVSDFLLGTPPAKP